MRGKTRLDELEDLYEHGGLYVFEVLELWVRRNPVLWGMLAAAAVVVAVL